MSANPSNKIQATTITSGELAKALQPSAGTLLRILLGAFFCVAGWMTIQDTPGLIGFAAILGGALLPMLVWLRHPRPGIPITALMAVQTIFVYGLPIVLKNKALVSYTAAEINRAGMEIGLFGAAMAGGWLLSYHPPRKRARPLLRHRPDAAGRHGPSGEMEPDAPWPGFRLHLCQQRRMADHRL
ncbi:MAG: hypothetical protein IPN11_14835 [Opitutaceae bacterium]|nr:hypothetical protein [Opitutaceae bacterium]